MKLPYYFSLMCFGIFCLNLTFIKLSLELPVFLTSYLNDLLCMPVVLGISLFIIRFFSRNKGLKISLFSAFSLATLYSLYFEMYLPEVTGRYTADPVDALFYFVGAFVFYLSQELPFNKSSEKKLLQ